MLISVAGIACNAWPGQAVHAELTIIDCADCALKPVVIGIIYWVWLHGLHVSCFLHEP